MPTAKKNQKKSNLIPILFISILIGVVVYFAMTATPQSEKYNIKAAGGDGGYRASFINVTGKNAEEKKIELSDEYWSSGKFD